MKGDLEGSAVHPAQQAQDASMRHARRQEIEDQLARAEKSRECLLEMFAAQIHQISQPLTALQGVVELALLGGCGPTECRSVLEDSLKELERLRRSVTALRDLTEAARESDGAGRPLPLIEMVGRTAERASVLAESLGAKVEIETQGDFHVFMRAGYLEQALYEVIRLALRRVGRDGLLRVSFSSGPGFAWVALANSSRHAPSQSPNSLLSKPFAGAGGDEAGGGDWMVARRIVELAGGRFEVTSGTDSVWVVRVLLPTASSKAHC